MYEQIIKDLYKKNKEVLAGYDEKEKAVQLQQQQQYTNYYNSQMQQYQQ